MRIEPRNSRMLRGYIAGTVQGVAGNKNYPRHFVHNDERAHYWNRPRGAQARTIALDIWPTTTNRYITGTVQGGEDNGDVQAWQTLSDNAVRRQIELEQELARVAGKSINWNLPEQVRELLRCRGH